MLQFRAQAADKGIPFVDLKNLSLQELQLYLLPVFRCAEMMCWRARLCGLICHWDALSTHMYKAQTLLVM
jgi:hypothetical protein